MTDSQHWQRALVATAAVAAAVIVHQQDEPTAHADNQPADLVLPFFSQK